MRVAAVDDEKMSLENILMKLNEVKRIQESVGFRSPIKLLEYMEEHKLDVVFLDINMRQMDGLTLAKKIKEKSPETFIIFVTGYSEYAVLAYRMHVTGYLLKPVSVEDIEAELNYIENPQRPMTVTITEAEKKKNLRVQCFGNFEVFINEEAVRFRRSKTKELFAYLIDRVGAACNTATLCEVLWEDEPVTISMKSQLRNYISELSKILEGAGASSVLIRNRNSYAINTSELKCDYYGFRKRDPAAVNLYFGEYMSQYSWAEMTLGGIESEREHRNTK